MNIPRINYPTFNHYTIQQKKQIPSYQTEIKGVEYQKTNLSNLKANYLVNFSGLKASSETPYKHLGTCFYRDLPTLSTATEIIKDIFPEGTDILDFAASNGEEAISLHTMLNDKNNVNYPIHCYDISDKAIKLANSNIHTVFSVTPDKFLITESPNKLYRNTSEKFHELMEETNKPDFEINDADFNELVQDYKVKYYKVKDEYWNNFKFEKGDIQNLSDIMPQKQVGAIFFRNAFYHLTNNHIFENVFEYNVLQKIHNTNRDEVIEEVVSKVYDKLLPGGIFVLGNDEKEHIYQADKFTPIEEFYFDDITDEYIRLKSPLEKALLKDGRFKPVGSSICMTSTMNSFEVNTVWQKVEK